MNIYLIPILIIVFLFFSIKIVRQQSALVIEFLGKYNRTLYPGINFIIPIIERVAGKIYLYLQNIDFEIIAITSDKVTISLNTSLVYKVMDDKVAHAFYSIGDPLTVIKSTIENSIRSYVANQTHEEILQKRDELTQYLVEHLSEKFNQWGYSIYAFQIKDVILPREITEAMSKVVASRRLREAAEFEAEANKILKVKEAEADMEARELAGLGVAKERKAIIDGLKASIEDMKSATGANAEEVMNVVMLTQYMDTLKTIGINDNSKLVFLNTNPKSLEDIMQNLYSIINKSTENK